MADWVLEVVEAAVLAAAAPQAGAAARAAQEVCGRPVNQARRLAAVRVAAEPVAVERAQVGEVAMAVVLVAQAVAVDLVEADRAVVGQVVVEEESGDRAEEQVEAAQEGELGVEQAVGPALSVSRGDG